MKICRNSLGANVAIAVQLLDALLLAVPSDQRIKYSQHVTAILDDPEEDITQPGIPLGRTSLRIVHESPVPCLVLPLLKD